MNPSLFNFGEIFSDSDYDDNVRKLKLNSSNNDEERRGVLENKYIENKKNRLIETYRDFDNNLNVSRDRAKKLETLFKEAVSLESRNNESHIEKKVSAIFFL